MISLPVDLGHGKSKIGKSNKEEQSGVLYMIEMGSMVGALSRSNLAS